MIRVNPNKLVYGETPKDGAAYTEKMNKIYTRYAAAYDGFIALFPLWKNG